MLIFEDWDFVTCNMLSNNTAKIQVT